METKRIVIENTEDIRDDQLLEAAKILKDGGLVAFPTETVYGLGANALDEAAAKKIYAAKGRPSDNPLIVHVAKKEDVECLVAYIPMAGRMLMEQYWPGPLTLVFPKSDIIPYGTTGGLKTVAIRMPSDPVANRLINLAGVPVAAPSANTSGRPSPTTADHVYQDMKRKIEMIVDGGTVGIGLESTIVDVSGDVPVMLRPGAVTIGMLREMLGEVEVDPAITGALKEDVKPKAPGMKYRHYAPKAELVLVEADWSCNRWPVCTGPNLVTEKIKELTREKLGEGGKVGIICTDETRDCYTEGIVRSLGLRVKEEMIAHNLFAVLREFDDLAVDYIFSECFSNENLGQAIMNRLTKASGYRILKI